MTSDDDRLILGQRSKVTSGYPEQPALYYVLVSLKNKTFSGE